MEQQVVAAEVRTERGKNAARRLRQAGKVPAVLYGAGKGSVALTLNPKQIAGLLRAQGQTRIFQLQTSSGESATVMLADPQFDPVQSTLLHVDLHRIAMDRKLRLAVAVVMVGEAAGIKLQGGLLEVVAREIEVECFPADIPPQIRVDVQPLMIGDTIRASDLQTQVGERVRILRDPQAVICHVVAPKLEAEKPAAEAAAEAPAEPEVIKKGKAAEEEGEEGGKSLKGPAPTGKG